MFTRCTRALVVLILFATTAQSQELVAYYNFDDGSTVTDQVGDNHGTIHNATFNVNTPDGSAASLDLSADGVGPDQDYVLIGPPADGFGEPEGRDLGLSDTNSFTIAAWVNYEQSQRGIVTIKQDLTSTGGDRSGITFGIDPDQSLFIGIIASTGDEFLDEANSGATFRDIKTEDIVPAGQWVHIAATYDFEEDTLVGYIDGLASEFYTVNPADSINDDGTNITDGFGIDWFDSDGSFTGLGASGNGPVNADSAGDFTRLFYDGLLDDVAIWNVAISGADIRSLADGSKKPTEILGGALPGDYNGNGQIDAGDLDVHAQYIKDGNPLGDVNGDGTTDVNDRPVWAEQFQNSYLGDSNFDGEFGSGDLVVVFGSAKYETGEMASYAEGDWNGDMLFNTSDLVSAFQAAGYEQGPRVAIAAVPEPSGVVIMLVGLLAFCSRRCR